MTTQTINTTIDSKSLSFLPKKARSLWENKKVEVLISTDFISIYTKPKPTLKLRELEPKLRAIGKKISKKDIDDAIRWAREQK